MTLIHGATIVPSRVHISSQSRFMHGVPYRIRLSVALVCLTPQILLGVGIFRLSCRFCVQ